MPQSRASRKITFFTPTMNRTGAEITLFNFINRINEGMEVAVISKYKGELLNLLPSNIARLFLYYSPIKSYYLKKIWKPFHRKILLPLKAAKFKNTVWYVNTITLPEVVEYAEKHKIKLIIHVHEREHFFAKLSPEELKSLIQYPHLIIACSKMAEQVLAEFGRNQGVEICYSPVDTQKIVKDKSVYNDFRKQLGIGKETFLWVMSGTMDANKNPNLFIDIAFEIVKTAPNTLFMWIGVKENELLQECKERVSQLGLSEKIRWIEHVGSDYFSYFNCADGFVLTSIKESFPLVSLEALCLELPIVSQDCGGIREILKDDLGQIIYKMNAPDLMAEAMIKYMSGELKHDVEKGKQRASEYDINKEAARWNKILIDYFNKYT